MGNSPKELYFRDKKIRLKAPNNMRFVWSQKTYDEKYKENPLLIHWQKNNIPRSKKYLDQHKGIVLSNQWDDIPNITIGHKKWMCYPTQKPEELLERIILTSSNEGDIVADFFCGSGTTLSVAKRLRRRFIGCDDNPEAVEISKERIKSTYNFKNIGDFIW